MQDKLLKIKQEVLEVLEKSKDLKKLKDLEIKYLGRKGELTQVLRGIASLNAEDKKKIGKLANEIKNELNKKFSEVKNVMTGNAREESFVDVTLPGKKFKQGHIHPITQITNELEDLFTAMGFMVLDGPEIESDYFNFTALNIPEYHPARDIQDTFYVEQSIGAKEKQEDDKNKKHDLVMRTHTSSVQVRAMQKYGAPLRCVVPGRVFRSEATDANHDTNFYQLEGIMIDEKISIANLISVLREMLSGIAKQDVKIRVRPGYFPFVEPGLEIDMNCTICEGAGCPSCKHSGWLEMLGAGMTHPNVLRAGGIDPKKYSGFAFGMGIDRLAMMRQEINDIRFFHSGDIRFLEQF